MSDNNFYLRKMRITLLILCLFITAFDVKAQPYIDLLNIQYGKTSLSKLFVGKDELKINHEWKSYSFNAPIKINEHKLVLISPEINNKIYQQVDSTLTTQQNGSTTISAYSRIHSHYISISLPVTFVYKFKNENSLSATLVYRQNKIFENQFGWTTDQLGGAILYTKYYNEKFKLKAGGYYNREFWGNYLTPLLGFEWKASKNIYCWGLLPNSTTVDVSFNKLHAGFAFRGIEESYSESYNSYFHDREGHLKLYLNYYLINKDQKIGIVFTAEGGQSVNRLYEFKSAASDNVFKVHPAENYFLRIGVAVRLITRSDFKLWPSLPM
ncbi:MAG: hypothetical protein ACKOX3_03260 [Bacteroidota bacterium]